MSEVVTMKVPQAISEPSLAIVLERIVRDPSVPLERLQLALELSERIAAKRAKIAFDAAFAGMADELPTIDEKGAIDIGRGKPQRYARLEDIIEATKPILSKHGFGVRFALAQTDKTVTATAILSHRDGHSEETPVTLPHDVSGSKNVVQSIGSAISYAQRYALRAALNLASRASQDDDGNAAGNTNGSLTEPQIEELKSLTKDCDSEWLQRFFKYAAANLKSEIKGFADIPASKFTWAKAAIEIYKP